MQLPRVLRYFFSCITLNFWIYSDLQSSRRSLFFSFVCACLISASSRPGILAPLEHQGQQMGRHVCIAFNMHSLLVRHRPAQSILWVDCCLIFAIKNGFSIPRRCTPTNIDWDSCAISTNIALICDGGLWGRFVRISVLTNARADDALLTPCRVFVYGLAGV
jgi:hypothetical protein